MTLPGFYDGVDELPPDDQDANGSDLGFDAKAFLGEVGLSIPAGETRPLGARADLGAPDLPR